MQPQKNFQSTPLRNLVFDITVDSTPFTSFTLRLYCPRGNWRSRNKTEIKLK